ncbi:MAG: DUF4382 domain-containing protein [Planctomycetota bacterium]
MRIRSYFKFWMAVLLLAGCSGGGSGGDAPGTSEVAVLISDRPAAGYESIVVTIREVSLIPTNGGAPEVLFASEAGEEIDLLDLRDDELLLTIRRNVPAGSYDKIRLEISEVRSVGGPCDTLEIMLPGGEFDLTPENPIALGANRVLLLHLDIDADKSIRLMPSAASGECIFSPVIRVMTEFGSASAECPQDLVGTVLTLSTGAGGETDGLVLDLGPTRGTVEVDLIADTGIFDSDGLPADASVIEVGQVLTVRGQLGEDAAIDALVVVIGQILVLTGTVDSVAGPELFVFDPAPGQSVIGSVDVSVADGTLILADCAPTSIAVIQPDVQMRVHGKLSVTDSVLRAIILEVESREIRGSLIEATEVTDGVEIVVIPAGEIDSVTIFVPSEVGIFLQGDGEIPFDVLTVALDCAPREVTVEFDAENPSVPSSVVVDSDDLEGVLESVDVDAHVLILGGSTVLVQPGATILDLRGGEQQPIALSELEPGATLRVFGLAACEGDSFDFYAFVVLVIDSVATDGDEGCGSGYWKQSHHFDDWAAPYVPDMQFAEVFEDAFPGKTLLEVLQQGGGGLVSLGRQTVAALLNAASEDIDYGLSAAEVIDLFASTYPGSSSAYSDLKQYFAEFNESSCPLGGDDDDDDDDDGEND